MKEKVWQIIQEFKYFSFEEKIQYIKLNFNTPVFSTSFGKEDQVITHLLSQTDLGLTYFTLDTGRLFEETYEVANKTLNRYEVKIQTYYPNTENIEILTSEKGFYSFYDSVENRKECCFVRKIEPLKRAIKGKDLWITGLRKEQSENRTDMNELEWDEANQIVKFHPIFFWTEKEVDDFIEKENIPINVLHKKGFPSIGCSPCTRAIEEGEDFRAGRWWWENSKKECGLHSH